jgi:hypothetical protein
MISGVLSTAQCLTTAPSNLPVETTYMSLKYPGQMWTLNDQCQQIYGNFSSFCQVCLILNFLNKKLSLI